MTTTLCAPKCRWCKAPTSGEEYCSTCNQLKSFQDHPETEEWIECCKCHRSIKQSVSIFNNGLCNRCASLAASEKEFSSTEAKKALEARQMKWLSICPERYRNAPTDQFNIDCINDVMSYKMGSRGILCFGESGKGKTTLCWKLLEKLFLFQGVRMECMTEAEFSQNCSKTGIQNLHNYLEYLCLVPMLFIDDIGHSASTARHLEDLYYVVEKRTAWRKPILATTQFTSSEMQERAKGGAKTITAIVNRLKGSCKIIQF